LAVQYESSSLHHGVFNHVSVYHVSLFVLFFSNQGGFMRQTSFAPVVLLALNLASEAEERRAFERAGLSARVLKSVDGCYKGKVERSYVVDVGHDGPRFGELDLSLFRLVLDFAESHDQDSVLFLSYSRRAQLIFCNSRDVQDLGIWTSVPEAKALASEAWTRDGNTYYIVKGA
jgi:hypothetical protein